MSDATFTERLMAAIQAEDEATLVLQGLASELMDHCERRRQFTRRLAVLQDVVIEKPVEPPLNLPRVLAGGPRVGER